MFTFNFFAVGPPSQIVSNVRNIAYFVLLSVCVFSVAIIGCGGDDEEQELSPTEQLTGRYNLEAVVVTIDSVSLDIGTDSTFAGELNLGADGQNASYTIIIDGEANSEIGGTWKATSTNLTFNWLAGSETFPYTFDGTYLEWEEVDEDGDTWTIRWRKIE